MVPKFGNQCTPMLRNPICLAVLAITYCSDYPACAAFAGGEAEACDAKECPERKSLLQWSSHNGMVANARSRACAACPLDNSKNAKGKAEPLTETEGKAEPLTETGFERVRACCCPAQMQEFIRRMVQQEGNMVCQEGGLAGVALWYYCDDFPDLNFATLVKDLGPGSPAQSGDCPWIGYGLQKEMCPTVNPTLCSDFVGATRPPCVDCSTTSTPATETVQAAYYWLDDGCQKRDDVIGRWEAETSPAAAPRCCDGTRCSTPSSVTCPQKLTQAQASAVCTALGKRLCTKAELLSNMCCRTGGKCDNHPVWTSTKQASMSK